MYEDLTQRLRETSMDFGEVDHISVILLEAADVIEELSEYVNTVWRLKCEGWYLQQTKYHDGYHAVATMPLPEPPKEKTE